MKTKVILYNQYGQRWSLRIRNWRKAKGSYIKRKKNLTLKEFFRRLGRSCIYLNLEDESFFRQSILVVDNGYSSFSHLNSVIHNIKEYLPEVKLSTLTLEQRKGFLEERFPEIKIILPQRSIIRKYQLANQMLRLRKNKYDYIILLSLDITPIIVSLLFMQGRVILYNRWQQRWSFKIMTPRQFLIIISTFIFRFVFDILIFIYLSFAVLLIFLKKTYNSFIGHKSKII